MMDVSLDPMENNASFRVGSEGSTQFQEKLWSSWPSAFDRARDGRRWVKRMIEVLEAIHQSQDNHAKSVLAAVTRRKGTQEPSFGSVEESWDSAMVQMTSRSQMLAEACTQLKQKAIDPAKSFVRKSKSLRLDLRAEMDKADRRLATQKSQVQKQRKRYLKICQDTESLQNEMQKESTLPNGNTEALGRRISHGVLQAQHAESSYKREVGICKKAQEAFDQTLERTLNALQRLEIERGEVTKNCLTAWVLVSKDFTTSELDVYTSMLSAFEQINIEQDIQQFLVAAGVDQPREVAPEFMPYKGKERPQITKKPMQHVAQSRVPATALYAYKAQSGEELDLQVGQKIWITEMGENGWWLGEADGRQGCFPSAYVKINTLESSPAPTPRVSARSVGSVAYPFSAGAEGELTVIRGEQVQFLSEAEEGWVCVRKPNTGEEGLVPASYIQF